MTDFGTLFGQILSYKAPSIFSASASDAQLWNHQTNSRESKEKTELLAKRQFRRGVGKFSETL